MADIQTRLIYTGNGTSGPWPVPAEYLSKDYIHATLNGASVEMTWVNDSMVAVPTAVGDTLVIERTTDNSKPITVVQDDSTLAATDLNVEFVQLLHLAQEGQYSDGLSMKLAMPSLTWAASGRRIAGLGYPAEYTDAATRGFVGDAALDLVDKLTPGAGANYDYPSKAAAAAASIPMARSAVRVAGFAQPGDGGAAIYKRAASQPAHSGWFLNGSGYFELAEVSVNPSMFGAVGDGIANDTVAVQSALTFPRVEFLAGKNYRVTSSISISRDGAVVTGPGRLTLGPSATLTVSGAGVTLDGVDLFCGATALDGTGRVIGIKSTGLNAIIRRCHIGGVAFPFVQVEGARTSVEDNVFDGSTRPSGGGIAFTGANAKHCRAVRNRWFMQRGFGIQTRLGAQNILIADNIFYSPADFQNSAPATADQTVFTFALPFGGFQRFSVQKNGIPLAQSARTISVAETIITVTLTAGATAGDIVTLVSDWGLEQININSQSYDIVARGNQIDGTGDSGIVICSDYHNGLIDAAHTTPEEYPDRVVVDGNIITNTRAACVAMTAPVANVVITNNNCSNWSLGLFDAAYSAAIVCTGQGVVDNNIIIGNGITTRFGVTFNTSAPSPMSNGDAYVKFGKQKFSGSFTVGRYFIPSSSTTSRKTDVILTDQPFTSYPGGQIDIDTVFAGGKPADTPYLAYSSSLSGWTRETTDKIGGVCSVRAAGSSTAEAYTQAGLLARGMLLGTILKVEFAAKAEAGTGFARVYTTVAGGALGPRMDVTGGWRLYTYLIAITSADQIASPILVRLGADANSSCLFQNINISYQRIPQ